MEIFDKREAFKPFEYEWAHEYWLKQHNAHWLHTEISMQEDINNWNTSLTEDEKYVLENILSGFTQTECAVEDYWTKKVSHWFPKHEIIQMANAFGDFEGIHATAYSYLNESLGLEDWSAFLSNDTTMERLNALVDIPLESTKQEIIKSLALFSAFTEGVSLFSQFAIILSFKKPEINKLRGMGKQMEFSCRDESLHSEAGCKLFRTVVEEHPELWTKELKQDIYESADLFMQREYAYLDFIFGDRKIKSISKKEVENFLRHRANLKLLELGLDEKYEVDENLMKSMDWFYPMVSGEQQTDFFAQRESGYAKANNDWNDL